MELTQARNSFALRYLAATIDMKSRPYTVILLLLALTLCVACSPSVNNPPPEVDDGFVKLSTFGKGEYADLVITPDHVIHTVYTDQQSFTKPRYVYYRASKDGGKTWSEPKNLSDDESGNLASYVRLAVDGKARVYCVWKYVGASEQLDGPGGNASGRLVFRCLEGNEWSDRKLIGDDKIPTCSWFVTTDPKGTVHVIWSQIPKDVVGTYTYNTYANQTRQTSLDGGALGPVKDIIAPKPLLTRDQQDALRAQGKYPKYEDTVPQQHGLINLSGYVDADGVAHFVAEDPGIKEGPIAQQTGRRIVYWDGHKLGVLHEYQSNKNYNTFNNPPTLVTDAAGKEYLIRAPEKAEKECVRANAIVDGSLGEAVDIIAPLRGPGKVLNWQARQQPGGRVSVTMAFSEKGGYEPEDLELYLCLFDGKGSWSAPRVVTDNAAKLAGTAKDASGADAVGVMKIYKPRFAATVLGKNDAPALVIMNVESAIVTLSPQGTGGGQPVVERSGGRVESPYAFFRQL